MKKVVDYEVTNLNRLLVGLACLSRLLLQSSTHSPKHKHQRHLTEQINLARKNSSPCCQFFCWGWLSSAISSKCRQTVKLIPISSLPIYLHVYAIMKYLIGLDGSGGHDDHHLAVLLFRRAKPELGRLLEDDRLADARVTNRGKLDRFFGVKLTLKIRKSQLWKQLFHKIILMVSLFVNILVMNASSLVVTTFKF